MPPERPLAWPWLAAPYVAQQATTIVLALVLQPPQGTEQAFYSIRFGVIVLASYAVLVGGTVLIARRVGDPVAVLAIRRVPPGRTAALVVVAFAVAVLAGLLLEPLFHGVEAQGVDPDPFPGGAVAAVAVALTLLGIGPAAGIAEELYFRGLVQGRLERFGPPVAIVATALIFAVIHFTPAAIPVLFVYGLVLGWIRARTGSIVPGAVAHSLNNLLAVALAIATA